MTDDATGATPDTASIELSPAQRERKRRLLTIRAEMRTARGAGTEAPPEPTAPETPRDEGDELNDFIKQLVDRRQQRRHQLNIIQDFFENPVQFGVHTDVIPTGTGLAEIEERKKELRYRINLLRSVLEALEGEMDMLTRAEISALGPDPANAGDMATADDDVQGPPDPDASPAPATRRG